MALLTELPPFKEVVTDELVQKLKEKIKNTENAETEKIIKELVVMLESYLSYMKSYPSSKKENVYPLQVKEDKIKEYLSANEEEISGFHPDLDHLFLFYVPRKFEKFTDSLAEIDFFLQASKVEAKFEKFIIKNDDLLKAIKKREGYSENSDGALMCNLPEHPKLKF